MTAPPNWIPPDQALPADLPVHARERLTQMRRTHFFTSDLSVNEFLLVKEMGFEPLGLVMGSSIYQIKPVLPKLASNQTGCELEGMTTALYHSRELAMKRLEEEADALGADGIIGVRLEVNLHAWGDQIAEFIAIGTAVKHRTQNFRNAANKPFQSDLTGQDFWTLLRSGYRPVGFVMGNCVYYVRPEALKLYDTARNTELVHYTHAFYDARELALERLQAEAEDLHAEGIVGVTVEEKPHSWRKFGSPRGGNAALYNGELLEFFVFGTAVVSMQSNQPIPVPTMVIPANK